MRKIGQLPDASLAGVFSDVLYVRGMENDIETEDDGSFSIWVHDDDRRDEAVALLKKFRAMPESPDWKAAASSAGRRRSEETRRDERRASNVITRERMEYERNYSGFALLPLLLGALSVIVTIFAGSMEFSVVPQQGGERSEKLREMLSITGFGDSAETRRKAEFVRERIYEGTATEEDFRWLSERVAQMRTGRAWDRTLPEIREGQVWRLFTPMFIHFGLLHIIFNMMWLRDLGSIIQVRFGGVRFLLLVLASAALSNLAQFYVSGPHFGGMSGVNYALFGFLWMRGKYDRFSTWRLNPMIVQMMLVWLVVCFTGLLGPVANTAHVVGLLVGMAAGFGSAKLVSRRRG